MSTDTSGDGEAKPSSRKLFSRANILVRRIHLYTGLFLLPWVVLYGITGAMFNHQELFPEATIHDIPPDKLTSTTLAALPSPDRLARQVVAALQAESPGNTIELPEDHGAEFNNSIILEVSASDRIHAVHIDPVDRSARVVELPEKEQLRPLLGDLHQVSLTEDPYSLARQALPQIMSAAGIESSQPPKPRGWCKLNFLASVNGEPARVTYVLRDGHVDVTHFEGNDGMTLRRFFLRLHTSHGQPPHWNGRMIWSVILDAMAIAMVTWAATGMFMWWQLKRARLPGGIVIAASVTSSILIYLSMVDFYATTKL
ncbi:MAG: PepSY domain-containing protein [Rhodopirellula sp.]|nr:PepSY domain-containing protein [Rhodopirellula sp.]